MKITFTDSDPIVKLNAPTVTEIEDMPIFQFHPDPRSERSKWAMDVILNWDGQFNETAKGILKTISDQNRGNNDWSSQWDGKYDDQVKDLVVVQMRAGTYDNLPEPIGTKSKRNVP